MEIRVLQLQKECQLETPSTARTFDLIAISSEAAEFSTINEIADLLRHYACEFILVKRDHPCMMRK